MRRRILELSMIHYLFTVAFLSLRLVVLVLLSLILLVSMCWYIL